MSTSNPEDYVYAVSEFIDPELAEYIVNESGELEIRGE